jgi:hypothetical protein
VHHSQGEAKKLIDVAVPEEAREEVMESNPEPTACGTFLSFEAFACPKRARFAWHAVGSCEGGFCVACRAVASA